MPSALSSPIIQDVRYYYGDPQIPRDIWRMRKSTMETMQRLGTPVLLKRIYTIRDVETNPPRAQLSPSWDPDYEGVRANDPVSNGVGFTSIDTAPGEWYDPVTFDLTITNPYAQNPGYESPDGPFLPAPMYRGYGPGFLTYVILPDRPEDVIKIDPAGILARTQEAKLQLPWWPLVGDNDLMITVELDDAGRITDSFERYQLKQVQPISMRGLDRSGRREFHGANASGNRFWVGQECDAVRVANPQDAIYNVEIDR